jgi:hypothetical protein
MFDLFFWLGRLVCMGFFSRVQAIQTGQSNKTESRSVHGGERSRRVKALKNSFYFDFKKGF